MTETESTPLSDLKAIYEKIIEDMVVDDEELKKQIEADEAERKRMEEAIANLPPMDVPISDQSLRPHSPWSRPALTLSYREKRAHEQLGICLQEAVPAPKKQKKDASPDKPSGGDTEPESKTTFEVENVQLRLPRTQFLESSFFSSIFSAIDASGDLEEPVVLKNVSSQDFGVLVKFLFPENEGDKNFTLNEWISILGLTTRWKLSKSREAAIQYFLDLPDLPPYVEVLILGRKFHSDSLVMSAYLDVLLREEHMSEAEIKHLGLDVVLRLADVREHAHDRCWETWTRTNPSKWHRWATHATDVLFQDTLPTTTSSDLVEQILFARDSGLPDLFHLACSKLAERDESLTKEEFERLGTETGLNVLKLRLEYRRIAFEEMDKKYGGYFSVNEDDFTSGLEEEFAFEIAALQEGYNTFEPASSDLVSPVVRLDSDESS